MSVIVYSEWVCDGCGQRVRLGSADQPPGWARFEIGRPSLTSEPLNLGHFCEDCTQSALDTHFRKFEHGERPEPRP